MKNNFAAIILAGGIGKRMHSDIPKVLHHISGKSMIKRTVETLKDLRPSQIIVVANSKNIDLLKSELKDVDFTVQTQPLGTADAAKIGLSKVSNVTSVAILYGDDTALYKSETIKKVYEKHLRSNSDITFVTLIKKDPTGLGRIVRVDGKLKGFVEEKDATEKEKKINEVNDGLYFFKTSWLRTNIKNLKKSPITGEYYINYLIDDALKNKDGVETYLLEDPQEWHGVNTPEQLKEANKKFEKNIHIMGIAGSGASAVAQIAKESGYNVTGCDLNPDSAYTKGLSIKVEKGHSKNHLRNTGKLIVSPAVIKFDSKNSEIQFAKKEGIPTMSWQKFQGEFLQKNKFVITIAGAYGKSTTTAMISQILIDANFDPTCEIGAKVIKWGTNFRVGKSKYYITEADEYNNNFLNYKSDIAIVLNTAWDHPDFFKTRKSVSESFKKFVANIKKNGTLVIYNNPDLDSIVKTTRGDVKIVKVKNYNDLDLSLIGDFRQKNANAALTLAETLGINLTEAKESLKYFKGIARRLEYKGQIGNTKIYDDYAVQPRTILATANALKEKFNDKKVLLVLEPHTYSRIKVFFNEFVLALSESSVDQIYITDVYAAREKSQRQNLSRDLSAEVDIKTKYTGSLNKTAEKIKKEINKYDIICSMGAGDSYKLYDLLKK